MVQHESVRDDYGIDYSYGNNLGEVAELVIQSLLEKVVLPQMIMWKVATMVTTAVQQYAVERQQY